MADCDLIGRREEAILGVSAGISQISNARGLDGGRSESISILGGIVEMGVILPILKYTVPVFHNYSDQLAC